MHYASVQDLCDEEKAQWNTVTKARQRQRKELTHPESSAPVRGQDHHSSWLFGSIEKHPRNKQQCDVLAVVKKACRRIPSMPKWREKKVDALRRN
jgi:hypothetical protein